MASLLHRRVALFGLLAFAAALPLGGCVLHFGDAKYKETRRIETAYADGMALSVESENGGVSVKRIKGDKVTIKAELKARTQERLDATEVVAERRTDGTLVVAVDWPDGKRLENEGCSFDISTPGAIGVSITSSNGAIEIVGLAGKAVLETSNGSVTVRDHAGGVSVTTSNGSIVLHDVEGAVTGETSNGEVDATALHAGVTIRSSNGGMDVELGPDSAGPVDIRTSNGGVTLMVGPVFAGEMDVDTSNGGVHIAPGENAKVISMGKDSAKVQFGKGGAKSRVETSNGGVRIGSSK